jgi:hypothetical protein
MMMRTSRYWVSALLGCVIAVALISIAHADEPRKTKNIIFVMTDGFRWQEVFAGADKAILDFRLNKDQAQKLEETKKTYDRPTPEARREAVLPFFWNVIAKQGQVFGNQTKKSRVAVTNGLKFSYPGFSETVCGFADPRVDRNDLGPNPNVSVFEWLAKKPAFQGRVAAFGAWAAFDGIFNRERCGFCVNADRHPLAPELRTPAIELLDRLKAEVPSPWGDEPYDALTYHSALEYFKAKRPRVLFVALGETDVWAHGGDYNGYLTAAHRFDAYAKELWETAQAMPEYRGTTTLIVAADHGRGLGVLKWRDHGKKVIGAEDIWLGVVGPDTPALGERSEIPDVHQSQIAATLAAILGEDYNADVPKAGRPIADVLKK